MACADSSPSLLAAWSEVDHKAVSRAGRTQRGRASRGLIEFALALGAVGSAPWVRGFADGVGAMASCSWAGSVQAGFGSGSAWAGSTWAMTCPRGAADNTLTVASTLTVTSASACPARRRPQNEPSASTESLEYPPQPTSGPAAHPKYVNLPRRKLAAQNP